MEPPTVTSGCVFSETTEILGVTMRKGDLLVINMQQIQHDSKEWREPEKFIPERFDSQSEYYLRPDGGKRHPLAFNPFIGGKRICLGKTFAEIVAKFVVPALLTKYKFVFEDKDLASGKKPKPWLNLDMIHEPVIMMRLERVNL